MGRIKIGVRVSRKFLVFIINSIVLLAVTAAAIFILRDSNLVQWLVGSFIANAGVYVTGNTVVSSQRSKHYHPELDDRNRE